MASVSIIVPIFNVEAELPKCISSIVAQTYKDIEIILVDDGSPDNCGKICDQFATKDNRIKVIHKENGGLVNARKSGLQASTSEFIAYVDGDDWIEEDFIESLVRDQKKYNVDIVAAGFSKDIGTISEGHLNYIPVGLYDKQKMIIEVYPKMLCATPYFCFGICSYVWNKLFKKSLLLDFQTAVDPRISVGEDTSVVFPLLLKAQSLYISDNCSYHYFQKAFSMLKSVENMEKEKEKVEWLHDYLTNALKDAPKEYEISTQVERYIDSLRIIRCGETNTNPPNKIFEAKPSERIAIFNSGIVGQNIYSMYISKGIAPIVAWFDRDADIYQTQELDVHNFDEIPNFDFDKIIVANLDEKSINRALETLAKYGVEASKIVTLL